MTYQLFLIIGAVLVGLPFMVACFKGKPMLGLIIGLISLVLMGLAASTGASGLAVHTLGFVIAGFGITISLQDH